MIDQIILLTNREKQIFSLVIEGFKNCDISKKLYISCKTVEVHKNNIVKKLNLKSTFELYCYGTKHKEKIL